MNENIFSMSRIIRVFNLFSFLHSSWCWSSTWYLLHQGESVGWRRKSILLRNIFTSLIEIHRPKVTTSPLLQQLPKVRGAPRIRLPKRIDIWTSLEKVLRSWILIDLQSLSQRVFCLERSRFVLICLGWSNLIVALVPLTLSDWVKHKFISGGVNNFSGLLSVVFNNLTCVGLTCS